VQTVAARWHLVHFGDSREQRSCKSEIVIAISLLLQLQIKQPPRAYD
jgi:hypothetical protein